MGKKCLSPRNSWEDFKEWFEYKGGEILEDGEKITLYGPSNKRYLVTHRHGSGMNWNPIAACQVCSIIGIDNPPQEYRM